MIYANAVQEVEAKRKAFVRKWRLRAAPSPTAWKKPARNSSPSCASRRAMEVDSNDERHRAIARGIQAAHQDAMPAALAKTRLHAFWALLASGQTTLRRVARWDTFLSHLPSERLTSPPECTNISNRR